MNKYKIVSVVTLGLCVAAPVSATGLIGSNPAVVPIQNKVPTNQTHSPNLNVLPTRLKPQSADLVIRKASISLASQCKANAPVLYVTASVQNIGHAASEAKFGVAMIQARDNGNLSWGNGHGLPALAAGQTTKVTFPIYYLQSNPASMQGRHVFDLRLNPGKWIQEASYSNNGFAPVKVSIPASFCGLLPDITSHQGPRIGNKNVAWGGSVTLGKMNASSVSQNGDCVFEFIYQISNDGKVATSPVFVNRLRNGRVLAAVNSNLQLKAGETQTLQTEPTLLAGVHVLSVSLDDGRVVPESNEKNNLFRVRVNVDKTCHNALVRPHRVNHL